MDKTVQELQDEVKVLKNEIKETLTDIREHLLTYAENPFATAPVRPASNGHSGPAPSGGTAAAATPAGQSMVVSVSGGHDSSPVPGAQTQQQADGTRPAVAAQSGASPATSEDRLGPAAKADVPAPPSNGQGRQATKPEAAGKVEKVSREEEDEAVRPPSSVAEAMESVPEEEVVEEAQAVSEKPVAVQAHAAPKGEVKDLFTLATLAPWMEDSVSRLGKERVKAIVEVYASMGGMSNGLRDVLLRLIGMDGTNGARASVSLRECMRALAELDNLLWRSRQDPRGAALYAALLNSKEVTSVPWGRE